jgi:hypothetical protein
MSIHRLDDGAFVIGADGMWLPGCYEDERAARFAFRVSDDTKATLRDLSILRGDGVITWGDIATAREESKLKLVRKE